MPKRATTKRNDFPPILWFPEDTGDEDTDELNRARNVVLAIQYESLKHPEALRFLDNISLKQICALQQHGYQLVGLVPGYAGYRGDSKDQLKFFIELTGYSVLG